LRFKLESDVLDLSLRLMPATGACDKRLRLKIILNIFFYPDATNRLWPYLLKVLKT